MVHTMMHAFQWAVTRGRTSPTSGDRGARSLEAAPRDDFDTGRAGRAVRWRGQHQRNAGRRRGTAERNGDVERGRVVLRIAIDSVDFRLVLELALIRRTKAICFSIRFCLQRSGSQSEKHAHPKADYTEPRHDVPRGSLCRAT